MMKEQSSPYVLSIDTYRLMADWASQNGHSVPNESFFDNQTLELQQELKKIFPKGVEVVDYMELYSGINDKVSGADFFDQFSQRMTRARFPILSLDRAYIDPCVPRVMVGFLDVTRAVNPAFEEIGLRSRPGSLSYQDQLLALQAVAKAPVTLVDDVVFSGGSVLRMAKDLEVINRPVRQVIAGIGVAKGINELRSTGIQVNCVREYEEVVDEVCERDFRAGVPLSGRTMIDANNLEWSAPYFVPFGNPAKWATIPNASVKSFSEFCLYQSIELWKEVEHYSHRKISTQDIPRRIPMLRDCESVVNALAEHKQVIKDY